MTLRSLGSVNASLTNAIVLEAKAKNASSSTGKDDEEETSTSRFVTRLLGWLLQGFVAKNKNVRYRCIHVVSEMISHLGEIEHVVPFLSGESWLTAFSARMRTISSVTPSSSALTTKRHSSAHTP